MLLLLSRHVSYKVGAQAGARPSAKTMCGCGERPVFNPQESDTPQYRYEPNAAATQKSESCGGRVRRSATQHATGGARAVEGSRLAEARAVGIAHVAICVFSVSVSVGVPEASTAHAHALPPLLADDDLRSRCGGVSGAGISPGARGGITDLHHELVAWQLQLAL